MYQGEYHGSKKHEADLEQVLLRAWDQGLDKMIITGGNLEESKKSIEMAKSDGKFIKFHFFFGLTFDHILINSENSF